MPDALSILLTVFLAIPATQGDEVRLRQALQEAGRRLLDYRNELKSFVCQETVRWETWRKKGGPRSIQRARFEFRVLGESEERTPLSAHAQQLPILLQGGYLSALYGLLAPENQSIYEFRLAASDADPSLFIVEAQVPRDKSHTLLDTEHGLLAVGYRARITIQKSDGRVRRLERVIGPVGSIIQLTHLLVYDEVEAGGQSYLLPVEQETLVLYQGGLRQRNLQRYRDYKKFSSTAKVRFK